MKADAYLYDYHYFWNDRVDLRASVDQKDPGKSEYTGKKHYRNERPLIRIEKVVAAIDNRMDELGKEIQGPSDSSEAKARRDELQKLKSRVLNEQTHGDTAD